MRETRASGTRLAWSRAWRRHAQRWRRYHEQTCVNATARHVRSRGDRRACRAGSGAGQGQSRRVPGELVAALFRGTRTRLLQRAEHRSRNGAPHRRSAERGRDDHQSDRRRRRVGDDRRHERQYKKARRRHVHLGEQPEQDYQMEQFVVRKGFPATSIKDLKGAKIMSAPGPANVTMAKAALAAVGLKEGDYTIDQLDMGQHVNVMQAGTFDAGYTLEPNASTMRKMGIA